MKKKGIALSLTVVILSVGLNINNVLAKPITELPITSSISYTFDTYAIKDKNIEANIEIFKINGLKNKDLETKLNNEFMSRGQSLYDEFTKQQEQKDEAPFYIGLDYKIKTDTFDVLSIVSTMSSIMASSSENFKIYNIDKQNQEIITLSGLFKDNSYIKEISSYIKNAMLTQMKNDESISYFVDTEIKEDNFEEIKSEQNFYINDKGQLVIVFDKYEVAPGYMGSPEFVIPTEKLQNILKNTNLII